MPTCKNCRFYEAMDDTKGLCFGTEVPADQDIADCPAHAFIPSEEELTITTKKQRLFSIKGDTGMF